PRGAVGSPACAPYSGLAPPRAARPSPLGPARGATPRAGARAGLARAHAEDVAGAELEEDAQAAPHAAPAYRGPLELVGVLAAHLVGARIAAVAAGVEGAHVDARARTAAGEGHAIVAEQVLRRTAAVEVAADLLPHLVAPAPAPPPRVEGDLGGEDGLEELPAPQVERLGIA